MEFMKLLFEECNQSENGEICLKHIKERKKLRKYWKKRKMCSKHLKFRKILPGWEFKSKRKDLELLELLSLIMEISLLPKKLIKKLTKKINKMHKKKYKGKNKHKGKFVRD